MPVQINEVIIRTIVDIAPVSQGSQQPAAATNDSSEYEAIEKVLEIIKEKNER